MAKRRRDVGDDESSQPKKRISKGKPRNEIKNQKLEDDGKIHTSLSQVRSVAELQIDGFYTQTITLKSSKPFATSNLVISEGVFKGSQAILLNSEPNNASSFLKLPAELRNMIYRFLFQEDKNTIYFSTRSLKSENRPSMASENELLSMRRRLETPFEYIAIFTANRQIYEEAAPLFYAMKTFRVASFQRFSTFLRKLGDTIKLIRRIYIDVYDQAQLHMCFRYLEKAVDIESIMLNPYHWGPDEMKALVRYSYPWPRSSNIGRSYGPIARALTTCFHDFLIHRYDITRNKKEVLQLFELDLSHKSLVHKIWSNEEKDEIRTNLIEFMDDFRKAISDRLDDYDVVKAERQRRLRDKELEVESKQLEEEAAENDFSYLERSIAGARRETGRPKRDAVVKHNFIYQE